MSNYGKGKRMPTEQLDKKTGEVLAVHASLAEAAKSVGKPGGQGNILKAIADPRKTCYGFRWRYLKPATMEDLEAEDWALFEDIQISTCGRIKHATATGERI
jgi:hypothetical protein